MLAYHRKHLLPFKFISFVNLNGKKFPKSFLKKFKENRDGTKEDKGQKLSFRRRL